MNSDTGSLETKTKTAFARRLRVRSVLRGRVRKDVRGATVSTVKVTVWLIPTFPARSSPRTAKPWTPSASGSRGVKGEVQGSGSRPSSEQAKETGRLALKPMLGERLLLSARGGLTIVIAGGRATSSIMLWASTSPAPTAFRPNSPTDRAVAARPAWIWAGVSVGFAWRARAAIAAACGAAAEVPQKRKTPGVFPGTKKVVRPQSVATTSGFWIVCTSAAAGVAPTTGPK